MAWNERRFVQFPHPGREHAPDEGAVKHWHTTAYDHRRKFLSLNGQWWDGDREHDAQLRVWGEWEPESEIVRVLEQPDERYPRYLWRPYLEPKGDYSGLHNTDPFIYDGFHYSNCKQGTSPALEGLRNLWA